MPKTINANQLQKIDRPYIQPIYLVHLLLSGLTLSFSDRNYFYNAHWMPIFFDMGPPVTFLSTDSIITSIENLGGGIVLAAIANSSEDPPEISLVRSTDYGISWTELYAYHEDLYDVTTIHALLNLGSGIVLAGTYPDGKILRSTDYGLNWTDLGQQYSQTSIYSLLDLGGGIVLAGTSPGGKILRSTDYGATWSDLGQQYSQTSILSLADLGGGKVIAGTSSGGKILRSTDYGATWSDLGQQYSQTSIRCLANLGGGIAIAGTYNGGKILRSTDYGATWADLGQQLSETYIMSLADLGDGMAFAGTYTYGSPGGSILISMDYGATWADQGQQFGRTVGTIFYDEYQYGAVKNLGDGIILVGTGNGGKILRSVSYGNNYEDYLIDISDIENQVRNLGGYDNGQVTLNFKNDKIRNKNYLIELFDDYPPEKRYVEIYKLLIDTGETFSGTQGATKIFKGEMGQPYEITELGFKIDCSSMLFGKNSSLPLDVIDLDDFPYADPDDVGKYRNIPYGTIKKLVCPWTIAGWVSTLTAEITAAATSIEISDATGIPSTPFTAMCDNEQIRVTVKSGTTLTVTRAYGGTTAVAHNKGATFYEKRSYFEAEVSQYPVKAIGDIYAMRRGEWVRIVSGWTKYLNSGSPARAYIRFDDKCKFEEKITITASTIPDEGSHDHAIPAGGFSSKQCVPDGSSGATGHANVIDGNTGSYCGIAQDEGVQARFDGEANLGVISKVQIWIYKIDTAATGYVQSPNGTNLQTLPAQAGWFRVVKTSGMAWTDSVVVIGGAGGNQIAEIYKIVEYTPAESSASAHAATDIDVVVTLSGNSVANMFIGDLVAADVEGLKDDASGTYTGTPSALIERPDHARKHILISLLGLSSLDLDSSFATVGAIYAAQISGGYKFSFNLPDVATESMELFKILDEQSRSNMFESGGKFILSFSLASYDDPPTSQITFNSSNVRGDFVFGKTEVSDIRNRIRGHYLRDYSKSGSIGEKFQKVYEGYDSTSIAKYGEMKEDVELSCIGDLEAMVADIIDWMIDERRELKKTVDFDAFWDAMILDNCDHFTVTSNFWSGLTFKTMRLIEIPESQLMHIIGLEYGGSE